MNKKNLDQFLTLNLDQFLTLKPTNLGPAFNITAYIYIYKHIHTYIYIYIYLSLSLSLCLSLVAWGFDRGASVNEGERKDMPRRRINTQQEKSEHSECLYSSQIRLHAVFL